MMHANATQDQWERLRRTLSGQYPRDWEDRLAAYRNGSDPDLQRWRAIGGAAIAARPTRASPPLLVHGAEPITLRPNLKAQVYALYCVGVEPELIAERLNISAKQVSSCLVANGVRRKREP